MTITRRVVELKQAALSDNGRLSGYGAVYGNIDDGGDEIMPGALAKAIPGFLKSGFLSWGHDWNDPVAFPVAAHEDASGLWIDAQFHSTPSAQEKRQIAKERIAAGLSMGLSIGYGEVKAERLPDRRKLLEIDRLYEVGLVMVPMNQEANVANLKSATKAAADNVAQAAYCLMTLNELIESESLDAASGDDDAADDAVDVENLVRARNYLLLFIEAESMEIGTTGDLQDVAAEAAAAAQTWGYMGRQPFADHLANVTAALKAAASRAQAIARLRKEGRVLSAANRTRLEGLLESLAASETEIRDLLASTEPDTGKAARAAEIDYLLMQARDLGLMN
jgi:HK97 family phage prohead protease